MCDPPCYHTVRSRLLEKYIKKLRRELIDAIASRRKAESALKARKAPKVEEEPREREREDGSAEERDQEVVDLVDQFQRRR